MKDKSKDPTLLQCTACKHYKTHGEFYLHKNNSYNEGRSYSCRVCLLRKAKEKRLANPLPKKPKRDLEDFWDINGDGIFM